MYDEIDYVYEVYKEKSLSAAARRERASASASFRSAAEFAR